MCLMETFAWGGGMETGGGRETGNGVLGAWESDLLEIRPVAEAVS